MFSIETTIKTIAQTTDEALYNLEFQLFSIESRIQSYLRMNRRGGYTTEIETLQGEADALRADIAKLYNVFIAMGGWERYIIVPGGHIHNYNCSTVYPTTARAEAYMHSAESVESLIEKAGDRACTVCFPDAPVNKPSTIGLYVKERKDQEQLEAERREREAKKVQAHNASIKDENGKVVFKTLRALTNEISFKMGSYVGLAGYVENFGDLFGHGKIEMNMHTREEYYACYGARMAEYKADINHLVELAENNGHDVTEYVAKTFTKKIKELIKECKKYPSGVEFPEGFTEKF